MKGLREPITLGNFHYVGTVNNLIFAVGLSLGAIGGAAGVFAASDESRFFGETERTEGALIGILYDFKQTQDRQPTGMTTSAYDEIVANFLNNGWDEAILNKYYRSTRELYATRFFIPMMNADAAPKAFGVGDTVKGRLWMVHYKGQVRPPHAGTFRFAGFCDDWIAVAVNGKNVFVSHWPGQNFPKVNWKSPEPRGQQTVHGHMLYGEWFELKTDEPVDLDIAMGEIPGGHYAAWLYYQEKDVEYEMKDHGWPVRRFPVLPLFQVGDSPMPPLPTDGIGYHKVRYPPFATGHPSWVFVP